MDHIAIMDPKRKLIQKILSGDKTVESRWYRNKIAPWGKIKSGDVVYFKDSGKPVSAKAVVAEVLAFDDLENPSKVCEIYDKYARKICLESNREELQRWVKDNRKRYCVLIFLRDACVVEPFNINKKGFGSACAWMCVEDIARVKK